MSGSKHYGTFTQWNSMQQKEGRTLCDCMDGTGEHYAKWNKTGGERHIPYDLTINRNLINKTNKQAKYSQRHWLRTRWQWPDGRGEGIMEGRVFRSYYKRHMDKTKGEGRSKGGRWVWLGLRGVVGKNADNCNWTTIKKKVNPVFSNYSPYYSTIKNVTSHLTTKIF